MQSRFAAAVLAACAAGHAQAAVQFTDWTTANTTTDVASGTVGSVAVTLSGTQINPSNVSGTATFFSAPGIFTPALAQSDAIEMSALAPASTFTLTFSSTVVDPVFHVADLSSTITFIGTTVTRVSGSSSLETGGDSILCQGQVGGSACRGTVMLSGLFDAVTFSAFNAAGGDGFYMQVGFDPAAPVPEPATWGLLAGGLALVAARSRRRR